MPAVARTERGVLLSTLTTLGLGGPAPQLTTVTTVDDLIEALPGVPDGTDRHGADRHGTDRHGADREGTDRDDKHGDGALIIGGGSNLVVADTGFAGPVIRPDIRGFTISYQDDDGALLTVGAGEDFDQVVARVVDAGFTGIETLSGIPGSTGATPIQNVGAYGTEIASVLDSVDVVSRGQKVRSRIPAADLGLGYRTSRLRGTETAVVTAIRLRLGRRPRPVGYAELARALGVEVGTAVPAPAVRKAVLDLRRSKGMVIDPADPDTRSAGSFFTNPILGRDDLATARNAIERRLGPGVGCPTYPADDGTKLSAAWLIERAGFGKGHALPGSHVAVSGKHTLALTNRGGGTTAELVALARSIRDGVREAFAVTLHPEPMLVGVSLDD